MADILLNLSFFVLCAASAPFAELLQLKLLFGRLLIPTRIIIHPAADGAFKTY